MSGHFPPINPKHVPNRAQYCNTEITSQQNSVHSRRNLTQGNTILCGQCLVALYDAPPPHFGVCWQPCCPADPAISAINRTPGRPPVPRHNHSILLHFVYLKEGRQYIGLCGKESCKIQFEVLFMNGPGISDWLKYWNVVNTPYIYNDAFYLTTKKIDKNPSVL